MKPVIENVLTSQRNTQAVKTVLFLKRKYFFLPKRYRKMPYYDSCVINRNKTRSSRFYNFYSLCNISQ